MASSTPDLSRLKLNHASNPSRKVRIVGKIRGFTDQELGFLSNSKPWITVNKSSDEDASGKVTILFGDKGTRKLFSGGKVTASKQTEVPSDDSLATKSSKLLQDTGSIIASSSLHEKTEVPPNDSVVTKFELQHDTISTITSSLHEEEAEVPFEPFQTDSISMIKTSFFF
nr:kinesin-like protein KIN-10C isoform X1 [Ipomoea batatas]